MNSVAITEENARDFEPLMGESLCEDMKREFFRGKGLLDDDETPVGAMVYELKNSESERDTESEIRFISPDPDTAMELFDEYDFDLSDEDIKLTRIETEEEIYRARLTQEGPEDFPYVRVTGGDSYEWSRLTSPVPVYDVGERVIWGLTGRATKILLDILKEEITDKRSEGEEKEL